MGQYELLKTDINPAKLETYLTMNPWPGMIWKTFFAPKPTPFLDYKALIGTEGPPVAADVVAYNSEAPEKTRKVISQYNGKIPAIRMKKKMDENDILQYNIAKATMGDKNALLDMIFDDVKACYLGVHAMLDYIACQILATSTVTFNKTYSAGIVTADAVDYQLPAARKRKVKSATATRAWDNASTTAMPITDFRDIVDAARDAGIPQPKYAIMNSTNFNRMIVRDECANLVWGLTVNTPTTFAGRPSLKQLNQALVQQGLPQVVVINTYVYLENENHVQTSTDPWGSTYVTFVPELQCGKMLFGPLAEELNPPKHIIQKKQDGVLISRWGEVDPVQEITKGETNAFPSWGNRDYCWRFDATGTPEADGLDD